MSEKDHKFYLFFWHPGLILIRVSSCRSADGKKTGSRFLCTWMSLMAVLEHNKLVRKDQVWQAECGLTRVLFCQGLPQGSNNHTYPRDWKIIFSSLLPFPFCIQHKSTMELLVLLSQKKEKLLKNIKSELIQNKCSWILQ